MLVPFHVIFEIDPPKDLTTFLYRCDDHFHVDILKDMLKDDNMIGILAIDAKDAGWGILHGDKLEVLKETGPGVKRYLVTGSDYVKVEEQLGTENLLNLFERVYT